MFLYFFSAAILVGIEGEIILINKYGTIVENSELKFLTNELLMVAPSPDDWTPEPKNQSLFVDSVKNTEGRNAEDILSNELSKSLNGKVDQLDDDMLLFEEKRLWLKDNINSTTEVHEIEKVFRESFTYQRLYFNSAFETLTIDEIRKNWPILLKPKFIKLHYSLLFNKQMDLRKTIFENIPKFNKVLQKSNRIRNRKAISSEREFIEGIFDYFNELHHQIYTEYDVSVAIIIIKQKIIAICFYFL